MWKVAGAPVGGGGGRGGIRAPLHGHVTHLGVTTQAPPPPTCLPNVAAGVSWNRTADGWVERPETRGGISTGGKHGLRGQSQSRRPLIHGRLL